MTHITCFYFTLGNNFV